MVACLIRSEIDGVVGRLRLQIQRSIVLGLTLELCCLGLLVILQVKRNNHLLVYVNGEIISISNFWIIFLFCIIILFHWKLIRYF
jgi:hypothetical protein